MLDFIYKYLIEMCVILEYFFGNEFFFFLVFIILSIVLELFI